MIKSELVSKRKWLSKQSNSTLIVKLADTRTYSWRFVHLRSYIVTVITQIVTDYIKIRSQTPPTQEPQIYTFTKDLILNKLHTACRIHLTLNLPTAISVKNMHEIRTH